MTWRLRVVHTTRFGYASPVTSSYNEARLTPRGNARQSVVQHRVQTVPPTRAYRYTDYWGTEVTAFDLHTAHTALSVTGTCEVETGPQPDGDRPRGSLDWAELAAPDVLDDLAELLVPTALVAPHDELAAHAAELSAGIAPVDVLPTLSHWLHDRLEYVPGSTGVHSSAADAWADRRGVCQDYAHITLVMLRAIGIPARYVSGYLHPDPDAVIGRPVEGQSHAWVEAWTGEWRGYDPTNDIPIGPQHITIGHGRDYADVPPLKGIFTGGTASDLDVGVELTRLA